MRFTKIYILVGILIILVTLLHHCKSTYKEQFIPYKDLTLYKNTHSFVKTCKSDFNKLVKKSKKNIKTKIRETLTNKGII